MLILQPLAANSSPQGSTLTCVLKRLDLACTESKLMAHLRHIFLRSAICSVRWKEVGCFDSASGPLRGSSRSAHHDNFCWLPLATIRVRARKPVMLSGAAKESEAYLTAHSKHSYLLHTRSASTNRPGSTYLASGFLISTGTEAATFFTRSASFSFCNVSASESVT